MHPDCACNTVHCILQCDCIQQAQFQVQFDQQFEHWSQIVQQLSQQMDAAESAMALQHTLAVAAVTPPQAPLAAQNRDAFTAQSSPLEDSDTDSDTDSVFAGRHCDM
jgi:hypothetical protein